MVEKISKASVNIVVAGNIDSSSDSRSLLKAIEKKKKQKQGDENALAAGMVSLGVLTRLNDLVAQGSGGLKTDKQAVKQTVSTFSWSSGDSLESGKDDSMRRKVALAAAAKNTVQAVAARTAPVQSSVVAKAASSLGETVGQKAESTSASGMQTNTPVSAQPSQNPVAPVTAPVATDLSSPVTRTVQQHLKDDAVEPGVVQSGEKQSTVVLSQQGETTTQSKNEPTTRTQLKTQVSAEATSAKQGSENQTLEVDYPFQRWSGDHSVKVSVSTDARREGNVTLLPSGARAAEALLRNMGDLTSLTPELLQPQQERDEQQQHQQQQQQQDEEQE